MEEISLLRNAIIDALGPSPSPNGEQELFDELMIQRERLLKVFDYGSRSAGELSELGSGTFIALFHHLQVAYSSLREN